MIPILREKKRGSIPIFERGANIKQREEEVEVIDLPEEPGEVSIVKPEYKKEVEILKAPEKKNVEIVDGEGRNKKEQIFMKKLIENLYKKRDSLSSQTFTSDQKIPIIEDEERVSYDKLKAEELFNPPKEPLDIKPKTFFERFSDGFTSSFKELTKDILKAPFDLISKINRASREANLKEHNKMIDLYGYNPLSGQKKRYETVEEMEMDRPIIKALNSPTGLKIINEVVTKTSNLPLQGYAFLKSFGDQSFDEIYGAAIEEAQDSSNPYFKKLLYQIQNTLPQAVIGVLLSLGTTALTRSPAAGKITAGAYFGALSASEQIQEKGKVTNLTNIGIDVALDSALGANIEKLFKGVGETSFKNAIKSFGIEGGTEGMQSLLKLGNEYINAREDKKQEVIDKTKNYVVNGGLLTEVLVGGISGSAISVIASRINTMTRNHLNQQETVLNQDLSKAIIADTIMQLDAQGIDSSSLKQITPESIKSWGDLYIKMTNSSSIKYNIKAIETIKNHIQTRWKMYISEPEIMEKIIGKEFERRIHEIRPVLNQEDLIVDVRRINSKINEVKNEKETREKREVLSVLEKVKTYLTETLTMLKEDQRGFAKLPERKQATSINEDEQAFKDFEDLSLKTLSKLEGKTFVSPQFISDLSNVPDLKQAEREVLRETLAEIQEERKSMLESGERIDKTVDKAWESVSSAKFNQQDLLDTPINWKELSMQKINVKEFADKVKTELLPLKIEKTLTSTKYESITLPPEQRGNIANYTEHIYESPVKTSVGKIHFGDISDNYFAHTRVEDMADNKTRRIIELQSDLFQKERLKNETPRLTDREAVWGSVNREQLEKLKSDALKHRKSKKVGDIAERILKEYEKADKILKVKEKEFAKLQPYRNTWHERIIKEEIKKASEDGKKILQFPTGETAMKIEGLGGGANLWKNEKNLPLQINELKVGKEISTISGETIADDGMITEGSNWIITEVLGEGKFKAILKERYEHLTERPHTKTYGSLHKQLEREAETFDISGKVDTSNPIYKFYEKDIQKYLKRIRPGMKRITDEQGVEWFQIEITKEDAKQPVTAYMLDRKDQKEITGKQALKNLLTLIDRFKLSGIDAQVVKKLLTGDGAEAMASSFGSNITFTEIVAEFAAQHELGHTIFRNLDKIKLFKDKGITRKGLLKELREKYPEKSNYDLEETLMEDLELYLKMRQQTKPTSFSGKIKEFFKEIAEWLERVFGTKEHLSQIRNFYKTIETGKAKETTIVKKTGQEKTIKGEDVVDFRKLKEDKINLIEKLEAFKGFEDLTLNTIEKLKGKTIVSKQFISDLTNASGIKQAEKEIMREVLKSMPEGKINVKEFADKVKLKLLPLSRSEAQSPQYEKTSLPVDLRGDLRGNISNYSENIYESPIKTSAGEKHFAPQIKGQGITNYFAHTRVEDLADNKTRRIIELQSDLFQKGNLEKEIKTLQTMAKDAKVKTEQSKLLSEAELLETLRSYRNTWHERIIKEEIKKASQDGKKILQFPTGETAMQIEGLGETSDFYIFNDKGVAIDITSTSQLTIGHEVWQCYEAQNQFIVTAITGETTFKAVDIYFYETMQAEIKKGRELKKAALKQIEQRSEAFDISDQINKDNPIYKFYENTIHKYLKKTRPDMKRITDEQGVEWFQIDITKEDATQPIAAFMLSKEKQKDEKKKIRIKAIKTGIKRGSKETKEIETRVAKRQVAAQKRQTKREIIKVRKETSAKIKKAIKEKEGDVDLVKSEIVRFARKNLSLHDRGKLLPTMRDIKKFKHLGTAKKKIDGLISKAELEKALIDSLKNEKKKIVILKKLAQINQTGINDIKKQLNINKPLSKLNFEELRNFIFELKNRYLFKKQTFPRISSTQREVSENTYKENRYFKNQSSFNVSNAKSRVRKYLKRGFDPILTPISTRLKAIHPSLKHSLRKFEYTSGKQLQSDRERVYAFLKKVKQLNKNDYLDLDLALKNGDIKTITRIIEKNHLRKEYKQVTSLLNEIYERATKVGLNIGYRKNYFPRMIKDVEGFLLYVRGMDDWSILDAKIREKENDLGRILNEREKAQLINTIIRGYNGSISLAKTGQMKARTINLIDGELNQFYEDSMQALPKYIYESNDLIEARKFFGKKIKLDPATEVTDLSETIGHYINNLIIEKKIDVSQEKEISDILKARFNARTMSGIIGAIRDLSYIDVLGSPINALTQLGDLAFAFYKGGAIETVKNAPGALINSSKLVKEDLGIEDIGAEFRGDSKMKKAADIIMTVTGFKKLDTLGKNTFISAVISKYQNEYQKKKPNKILDTKLNEIFEEEAPQVKRDLKNGYLSENVKYLAFTELLDVQPVALSEMPVSYLKAGNGRIFYMLKTWTLKKLDLYRNDIFRLMKTDKKQALKNLLRLSMYLILMEAGVDKLKDFILGRKIKFKDRVINNIVKLSGFSRYTLSQISSEGLGTTLFEQVIPPFQALDSLTKDIINGFKDPKILKEVNNYRIIKSIPIGGKLYYFWFGKGSETQARKNYKKSKKKSSATIKKIKIKPIKIKPIKIKAY